MSQTHAQSASEPLPTTPEQLFAVLAELRISYKLHHHDPIFTVAEGEPLKAAIPGVHCRNLFLADKKKVMYLVIAANETPVDLKALEGRLGSGRLSFGSAERLWTYLGIRPGSVCPFTLLNDPAHHVIPVLDAAMMEAQTVCYHPLDNSMTVGLRPADLLRFIAHTGHVPRILDL
jgi:Ala-tRNA(Pro) deacylase